MTRVFARLDLSGKVAEFIQEYKDITQEWHPEFLEKYCIEVTGKDLPEIGMIPDNGSFIFPPEPDLTPQEQMIKALASGCTIKIASNAKLNGSYYAMGPVWQHMRDEVLYIVSFGSFSGDSPTLEIPLVGGAEVVFDDTEQFKAVVRAIGDWITKWFAFVNGKSNIAPSLPIKIK